MDHRWEIGAVIFLDLNNLEASAQIWQVFVFYAPRKPPNGSSIKKTGNGIPNSLYYARTGLIFLFHPRIRALSTSDRNILNRSETKGQQRRIKKKQPSRKLCAPFSPSPGSAFVLFLFRVKLPDSSSRNRFSITSIPILDVSPHQQLPLTKGVEMFLNRTILILCLYDFSFRLCRIDCLNWIWNSTHSYIRHRQILGINSKMPFPLK